METLCPTQAVIIYLQDLTPKDADFLHIRDYWIIKIDTLNSQDCALWAKFIPVYPNLRH